MEIIETQLPEVLAPTRIEIEAEFLQRLGGPTALAHALNTRASVIVGWRTRGIPWDRRTKIAEMAQAQRVRVPNGFLVVDGPHGKIRLEAVRKGRKRA